MNKCNKIYPNILYETRGKIKFDLEKYKKFLNDSIKLDQNGNVITKDKQSLIDIPNEKN